MAAPTSIEDYLAALPDERRAAVEELRQTIKAAAPEASETIAYQMPALRSHGGQFLVSYAAYKNHYSLFPASEAVTEALGEELKPYLTGKGTIRFPADRAIPAALVTKVVKIRAAENAAVKRRE
ncbi:iron chaperone [soil metagenome]